MIKLNQKGVFFAATTAFFLISIIYFSSSIDSTLNSFSVFYSDISTASSVNFKFNSIYSNIILLDSSSPLKEIKERIVPFNYSLESNSFSLNFSLPLNKQAEENYFDYINSFRVLVSDKNYLNAFDGIKTEFFSSLNPEWGGEANSMNFLLFSHCAKNKFTNLNEYSFQFTDCSSNSFDFTSLNSIDLNFFVDHNEDFDSVYCNFNGIEECPLNEFDEFSEFPFIQINFNANSCNSCDLKEKIISFHFNPIESNSIIFFCDNTSCVSSPLEINLNNELLISKEGKQINTNLNYNFNSEVFQFEINDVSFRVVSNNESTEQVFSR